MERTRNKLLNDYLHNKSITTLQQKTALFAQDFLDHLKFDEKEILAVNDNFCESSDIALYAFDGESKIWKRFEMFNFKKFFIGYIIDTFGKETTYFFSNADLEDIYNLCLVYIDYIDFDIINRTDSGDLIININKQLFSVGRRKFIPWDDNYIYDCPFVYMFEAEDYSNDEIIKLFEEHDITPESFATILSYSDIESDISEGYSVFDLMEYLSDDEVEEDIPDEEAHG